MDDAVTEGHTDVVPLTVLEPVPDAVPEGVAVAHTAAPIWMEKPQAKPLSSSVHAPGAASIQIAYAVPPQPAAVYAATSNVAPLVSTATEPPPARSVHAAPPLRDAAAIVLGASARTRAGRTSSSCRAAARRRRSQ